MAGPRPSRRIAWLALGALLLGGCSLAPLTPRVSATSIPKGETRVVFTAAPTAAGVLAHGVTDALDVGIEIEQFDTVGAWSRYSILNEPDGTSLALSGGVFAEASENEGRGVHVGALAERRLGRRWTLSSGYRRFRVDYRTVEPRGWFSFGPNNGIVTGDTDDLSVTDQWHAALAYRLKSGAYWHVGSVCHRYPENTDPTLDLPGCVPFLGLSRTSR